jgi:hypothetical protein
VSYCCWRCCSLLLLYHECVFSSNTMASWSGDGQVLLYKRERRLCYRWWGEGPYSPVMCFYGLSLD